MPSYIFVSPGSDPGAGRALVDPMLSSSKPSMGTCRPDLRRMVRPGDHIFVISGSLGRTYKQYVIGGMQIDEKLEDQLEALRRLPENALRFDGRQRSGNIIALPDGSHDPRDKHDKFETRIKNYVLGTNQVVLETPKEIELGRERSIEIINPQAMRIYDESPDRNFAVSFLCENGDFETRVYLREEGADESLPPEGQGLERISLPQLFDYIRDITTVERTTT